MDENNKRFHWIKLRETFINSDAVDFLMSQKNGAEYVVLYEMLCLKTANVGGRLEKRVGEFLTRYDAEKIRRDCRYFGIDTVINALNLYAKLGLIYEESDGVLRISGFESMVGSETKWADYKREIREKKPQKIGQCPKNVQKNVGQKLDNVQQETRETENRDINSPEDGLTDGLSVGRSEFFLDCIKARVTERGAEFVADCGGKFLNLCERIAAEGRMSIGGRDAPAHEILEALFCLFGGTPPQFDGAWEDAAAAASRVSVKNKFRYTVAYLYNRAKGI